MSSWVVCFKAFSLLLWWRSRGRGDRQTRKEEAGFLRKLFPENITRKKGGKEWGQVSRQGKGQGEPCEIPKLALANRFPDSGFPRPEWRKLLLFLSPQRGLLPFPFTPGNELSNPLDNNTLLQRLPLLPFHVLCS